MRTKKCEAISIHTLTRENVFYHNEIKMEFCVVINCLILTRTDLHRMPSFIHGLISKASFEVSILFIAIVY